MRSTRDNYKSFGFWGVLYLFYMYVFPSATSLHVMDSRQLHLSLYVKAIICVGCALTRGRKERRTNANNGKNSNPELSKKSEIEGGNGQDTYMSSRNMNERHVRDRERYM